MTRLPDKYHWPVLLVLFAGAVTVASVSAGTPDDPHARNSLANAAFERACRIKLLDTKELSGPDFERLLEMTPRDISANQLIAVYSNPVQKRHAELRTRQMLKSNDEYLIQDGIHFLMQLDVSDWRELILKLCPEDSEMLGHMRKRLQWPDHALRPRLVATRTK